MGEHVGAEVVVIPFEAVPEILFYAVPGYVCEVSFLDIPVESPESYVESDCFCRSAPERFMSKTRCVGTVGRNGWTDCMAFRVVPFGHHAGVDAVDCRGIKTQSRQQRYYD